MKIDIFCHILPEKLRQELHRLKPSGFAMSKIIDAAKPLSDLDWRFRIMDRYPDIVQVLTLTAPPIEVLFSPEDAAEFARRANDEMVELTLKYPDRFIAVVASLPLNNIEASIKEMERTLREPYFAGIQIFTPIDGEPIDIPKYVPIYEKMAEFGLPIWIHPYRPVTMPDYAIEDVSKYMTFLLFGWPFETTLAMSRLVLSGVLERNPDLKFITHHCCGMVPYFANRIMDVYEEEEIRTHIQKMELTKSPVEYFRMFYGDTALHGNTSALKCAHNFLGAEHMLFGTDMPYGQEFGDKAISETIRSIQELDIPDSEKELIFQGNAKRILKLDNIT